MYSSYPAPPRSRASTSSTSTTRSSGSQRNPYAKVPGDVPTAVRDLFNATQDLREALRQWSVRLATGTQVSDLFVQVALEFNTLQHAFTYHHIDISTMQSFPKDLRAVLERCLAEEQSPEVLELFMPQVRQVLYKLVLDLKDRQESWRQIGGQMPMIPPSHNPR